MAIVVRRDNEDSDLRFEGRCIGLGREEHRVKLLFFCLRVINIAVSVYVTKRGKYVASLRTWNLIRRGEKVFRAEVCDSYRELIEWMKKSSAEVAGGQIKVGNRGLTEAHREALENAAEKDAFIACEWFENV